LVALKCKKSIYPRECGSLPTPFCKECGFVSGEL
jgi:hypothetical protein